MGSNVRGGGPQDAAADAESMRQIRETFKRLPHDITLYLFSEKGGDDVFCNAIRQVVRAFRQLTDKITFREYDLGHEEAARWKVTEAPTLLISPERYNIRWMGAPLGEEGRSFLEALLLAGMGRSNLNEQSRKVLEKLDTPRSVRIFVSPTCPYCPQQTVNGIKAAIERPDLVSVEIVDIQCRPDLAEKYNAHSVPQAFADDVLIGMGAQSEEVFALSLQKMEPQTLFIPDSDAEVVEADLLIVGGGPAGLTAGIYAVRSGLKAVLVEREALGGQVATTPVVENYPGFTQVGGKTLVDIMVTHALQYVKIFQGEEVVDIRPGPPFTVQTSRRKFIVKTILLATGASHKHLGVPGEKRLSGRGVSYCATCDGPLFKGRRVVVVGGGNTAVTEALYLHNMGVDVTLVHRRDKLRAQEALARQLAENDIAVLWNTRIKEIRGKDRVEELLVEDTRDGTEGSVPADGVFIAIGYTPTVDLARRIGVELTPEGYIRQDGRHRTSVPGIYSAGDVEGGWKQIVTAAGTGAEAAMAIFEDLINPYWQKPSEETTEES